MAKQTTSLSVQSSSEEINGISETLLLEYMDSMGLTDQLLETEKKQFLAVAQAYGLNPFKRDIYATIYVAKNGGKRTFTIIVGYEVYLKRAEESGQLDGWKVDFLDSQTAGIPFSATVTIWRKDRTHSFEWTVYYHEQVQTTKDYNTGELRPTAFWVKAYQQLRKVAISQAFRLYFPEKNGGMPYTREEMPDYSVEDTTAELVKDQQKVEERTGIEKINKVSENAQAIMYNDTYAKISEARDFTTLTKIEDAVNGMILEPMNKEALLKHSITRRAELCISLNDFTATAKRLAAMKSVLSEDNITAAFGEIIEAADVLKIGYKDKKFYDMVDKSETQENNDLVTYNNDL